MIIADVVHGEVHVMRRRSHVVEEVIIADVVHGEVRAMRRLSYVVDEVIVSEEEAELYGG